METARPPMFPIAHKLGELLFDGESLGKTLLKLGGGTEERFSLILGPQAGTAYVAPN